MRLRGRIKWWLHTYVPGRAGWFWYYGMRVYFPPHALIFDLVCAEGIYEADLTRVILSLVRPGSWYFDLGANIGLMSVPVVASAPELRVLSFEPSPNSLPYLLRTHSESAWASRWQVCPKAASSENGTADFAIGPRAVGGYDGLRHTQRQPLVTRMTIETTTVDAEWRALGSPDVSVIKLDVEGAEFSALRGARDTISTVRPAILLEWYEGNFTSFGHHAADLLTFGRQSAYDVFALPAVIPVATPTTLTLHMSRTSAFLLLPSEANAGGRLVE